MITKQRQQEILSRIVEEYIKSATPVSSSRIAKDCGLDISPATIRNDMQILTNEGFLSQPHTSAGRIPTDKAYRFFVDKLHREGFFHKKENFNKKSWVKEQEIVKSVQNITKDLANKSSGLAISYLSVGNLLLKEGWEDIFQEPEFRTVGLIKEFIDFLENFEEGIEVLEPSSEIKVYIGKEIGVPGAQDFSIIISECYFPQQGKGWISILGPKRMAYRKNIALIDSFKKLIEEF